MPEMLHTHGARTAMIRPMAQESGSFSRLDVAVMAGFSLLGLVLMYLNATDPGWRSCSSPTASCRKA